jgi:hypothetical protein
MSTPLTIPYISDVSTLRVTRLLFRTALMDEVASDYKAVVVVVRLVNKHDLIVKL